MSELLQIEQALMFIRSNRKQIFQIFINHLKDGYGIIFIHILDKEVQVSYVKIEVLPANIIQKLEELMFTNDTNIIYVLLIPSNRLIELDVRDLYQ